MIDIAPRNINHVFAPTCMSPSAFPYINPFLNGRSSPTFLGRDGVTEAEKSPLSLISMSLLPVANGGSQPKTRKMEHAVETFQLSFASGVRLDRFNSREALKRTYFSPGRVYKL